MAREYALHSFRPAVRWQIDYERDLNPQQLAAVTAPPGPALVIAGAGSGKTRLLTYRVAYLLEQGVPPERILLLTFTNKAAREMMRRVADLLGQEVPGLWGGTFHAIGHRILRQHADLLGYPREFSILDREDAKRLLADCVKQAGYEAKDKGRFPKPEVLLELFALAANLQQPLDELLAGFYDYSLPVAEPIQKVHDLYRQQKRAAHAMDFDDLLTLWLDLLRQHADVCEHWQRRFQFLLVDEYQDTNVVQSAILDLLAARHRNLMVVGDDAQSIYGWRGADYRNILGFPERYPEARIYKIETNYRSTPEILHLANAVLQANRHQFPKVLVAARPSGCRPVLVVCGDAQQQAAFVAQRVSELHEMGIPLDRMAVLYRAHFHAMELQMELQRRGIPFSITSGLRFFEQAHIKDVTAYLRLVANPRDHLAFSRVVQLLPGIGAKGAEKLWHAFQAHRAAPESGSSADPLSPGDGPIAPALEACKSVVSRKVLGAWAELVATVAELEKPELWSHPGDMILCVLANGYEDYLRVTYPNYRARKEELEQLAIFARQFGDLHEFLAQLALLTNVEAEDDTTAGEGTERLRLSTIHQAKGLEFDVVFVIMLCDGMFPSARSLDCDAGEEEERRLFYVAVTRARDHLYLTYPLLHFTRSGEGDPFQRPSRFLQELPRGLYEEWTLKFPGGLV